MHISCMKYLVILHIASWGLQSISLTKLKIVCKNHTALQQAEEGCSMHSAGCHSSDSCSSLQVLFDFSCVLPIEALCLLVELGVPFIDVVNICIIIIRTSPAVLLAFLNSARQASELEDLQLGLCT